MTTARRFKMVTVISACARDVNLDLFSFRIEVKDVLGVSKCKTVGAVELYDRSSWFLGDLSGKQECLYGSTLARAIQPGKDRHWPEV